ncbi:MAG: hypothetical protein J6R59_09935 [Paludibacteraceae bacterium]|nr:hypothetical protein [Paludibacteraceae bacterium]
MFKSIDKKFEKIGFIKTKEDKYGVTYERENAEYNFTQVLDILHKANGRHIVLSYVKDLMDVKNIGNTCVGLTYYEMKLILKKMRQLGYHKA